jgi:hypothetical protein
VDASGGFGANGAGVVGVVDVGVVDVGVVGVVLAASDMSGITSNAPTTRTPIAARTGKITFGAAWRPWVPLDMPD